MKAFLVVVLAAALLMVPLVAGQSSSAPPPPQTPGPGGKGEGRPASNEPAYSLNPLGDVDKDGVADLLLATERQFTSLTAVSGATFKPLWELDLKRGQVWRAIGDLTGDGVEDLELFAQQPGTGGVPLPSTPLVYSYQRTTAMTYTYVSGADGKELFSKTCSATMAFTFFWTPTPLVGASADRDSYSFCMTFDPSPDAPYVDIVLDDGGWSAAGGHAVVAGGYVWTYASKLTVDRYDAKGAKVWGATFGDGVQYVGWIRGDVTGDKVPDYVILSDVEAGGGIFTPVVFPYGYLAAASQIAVYDGKTGAKVWGDLLGVTTEESYVALADADGAGLDVWVHTLSDLVPGPADTKIVRLNGADGKKVSEQTFPGHMAFILPAGDMSGDSKPDLFLIKAAATSQGPGTLNVAEEGTLGATDGAYKPLWEPVRIHQEDWVTAGPNEPDFNGDGAPEFLMQYGSGDRSSVRSYDGKTGKQLWSLRLPPGLAGWQAVPDVDGTPGMDVAVTSFDVPREKVSGGDGPKRMVMHGDDGGDEGPNWLEYAGRVQLLRGSDLKPVWNKQIHDPAEGKEISAGPLMATHSVVPDLNGNKYPELLVSVRESMGFGFREVMIMGIGGPSPEGGASSDPGFGRAFVLDGAQATALRTYPDKLAQAPPQFGEAAPLGLPTAPAGNSPALGLVPVALLAALVVALRRRHA